MLLQPTLHQNKLSLSPPLFFSPLVPSKSQNFILHQSLNFKKLSLITCSSSKVRGYGTLDFERRSTLKWTSVHRRISLMKNPELGAGSVLDQCEKEGNVLTKWEVCRIVKELRKFKRFKKALEVYDWMGNRGERYRVGASDAAIQLDLIAKVCGVATAEYFFSKLPKKLKDRRVYGSLLNVYAHARMREKAESIINQMRNKGYATHPLPFNVMMTLYMNLKEYDKVEEMISEMTEKNIALDICSYNIWLSSRGSVGSVEKVEEAFEQMKRDGTIDPNWTTYSTMASMYIRMGQLQKAEAFLRRVESKISGRDRIPYHYLLSLYGNVGNKEEVLRVWNTYKRAFSTIPNLGYRAIISSMVQIDDIELAEKIYEEWLSVKSNFDPRILNLIMGWYVKAGNWDRAKAFFDDMVGFGGKPNPKTWEILAEGHINEKRLADALSCFNEAYATEGSESWRPNPANITSFFKLCEEERDLSSKKALERLLMQSGRLNDEDYAALVGLPATTVETSDERVTARISMRRMTTTRV